MLRLAKDAHLQQPRTMVVRICDAELLAQVSKAVVKSTIGHANVVRTHPCFTQHVWTKVMGPVSYAILQTRLVERIEKQSERVNLRVILESFRNPHAQAIFLRSFQVYPHVSLV